MKGLLMKEFIMLKKGAATLLIFLGIFGLSGLAGNTTMLFLLPLFSAVLLYGHINYDEQSKWQQYSIAMPYGRKMIVSAKYVAMAIAAIISTLLLIMSYAISIILGKTDYSFNSLLGYILLSLAIGIIYPSLFLPLAYKFNSEKGRTIMMFLNGASGAIAVFLLTAIDGTGVLVKLSNYTNILPYILIAVLLVLFALSWFISVKIYEKRDL